MAVEAERVVVEVLAKMDGFDAKVQQGAQVFDGSMKKIETSGARAEKAVGTSMAKIGASTRQLQQNTRNLGFQISDISTQLAAGTSPFLILAQQGPQVANALEGAKGAVGRFAAFLSGPYGAALLGAITLLGVFGEKLLKSGESVDDLVKKMKKQAAESDKSEKATKLFNESLEGLEQAAKDAEKALKALEDRQKTQEQQTVESIQQELNATRAIRAKTEALLDAAEASNKEFEGSLASADPRIGNALKIQQSAIDALRKKIEKAKKDAEELEKKLTRAISFRTVEEASLSGEEAINRKYDLQVEGARKAAVATGLVTAALEKQVKAINAARDAEIERYRKTERERRKTSTGLPDVTGREIARALGTSITSGTRTAAENRAAKGAANSYHLSGQAIDIPLTVNGKPLTKTGIRAALEPLGVQIKELLGPGDKGHSDHFHIAFSKKRRGPDEVAAAQQKAEDKAARLAEAEIDRQQRVADATASLDEQILRRKQDIADGAAEQAEFELQAVDQAQQLYDAGVDALAEEYKRTDGLRGITDAQAKILKGKRAEVAELDRQMIERQEQKRIRQENLSIATGLLDNNLELLRSEEDLATSQKDRRRLALAILDAEYEKLRLALETSIADGEAAGVSEDILNAKRAQLRNLQTLKSNAVEGALKDTASPFESYIGGIRETAGALDEAFEEIAVGSLQSVVDGLGQAAAGFTSLGDVGRQVLGQLTQALVRLALQQLLLKTLGDTVGKSASETATASGAAAAGASAASAATIAQAAGVAAAWAPAAAAASLATLGANAAPAAAALVATHALSLALSAAGAVVGAGAKALAGGGRVFGPGTGTSDDVPLWGSNGEFMMRTKAAQAIGYDNLEVMNRTGKLPAFLADGGALVAPRINNSPAAPTGGAGRVGIDDDFRRELRRFAQDALHAMPDVVLQPTLDIDRLAAALYSHPGAQRRFFDMVGQNSGKFNNQLGK